MPPEAVKNDRHTFPIGAMTKAILEGLTQKGAYVFPARHRDGPSVGFSVGKADLNEASGVTGWTLHDLRRTFATNLAELRVAPHVIERLLNHVTGSLSPIALRYNKATYGREMAEALTI